MILDVTIQNIGLIKYCLLKLDRANYQKQSMDFHQYNRIPRILWTDEQVHLERMLNFMLDFKNASGEIVMSEKDNGKLEIHDEALKESIENQLDLEEAKKKVADNDEL